jgi:enediyne biosynthesis protein E4
MTSRKFTRRQRLLLRTSIASVTVLIGVAAVVFYRSPGARYNPGERVEGITAELDRRIPPDYPRVTFTETAEQAGISFQHFSGQRSTQLPEDMGSGAAWGDYDNDGNEDLFVVNICGPLTLNQTEAANSPATCKLYHNNGDGSFSDVTEQAKLSLRIWGMGAAWGDFDGDGRLDLVVTSYPSLFLFHNNGDGTFSDVSASSGLGRFKGFWSGASWADYDNDGDLDLYVCGYVQYHFDPADWNKVSAQFKAEVPFTLNPSSYKPERNLLFRNNGDGSFTEVAKQAGVDNLEGRSLSAAWCDFDDDGLVDLYVANDVSDNKLFKNLGNGKFADVSQSAWVADYRGAMGLAIGDWDGDGDFDIFITHWLAQENALYNNMRIAFRGGKPGKMVFMDVADQYGLGQASLDYVKWGTAFFDYDNDGKPDLFVVCGSTFQDEKDKHLLVPMRHLLFWNRGDPEGFFETSSVSGAIFQQKTVGRGAAFADYDNDGDMDIFVVNHNGRAWLLRNDGGNQNHWLKVKLRGQKNRFGVGAKVRVMVGDKLQMQQIGSQPSYLSGNSLIAHFGLGTAETVDSVIVTFPSGKVAQQQCVKSNQTITIEEP